MELSLTQAQWNGIYKTINLQKERIALNTQPNDNERKAIEILQKYFKQIENLADLESYKRWAEHRTFIYEKEYQTYTDQYGKEHERLIKNKNTFEFKKCILDYISTDNESRWWKAVIKKQKHLQNKITMFNKLSECILEIEETNLEETSVICPYPKYEKFEDNQAKKNKQWLHYYKQTWHMAINRPKFAKLEGNKGHLFVECEEGHKVWLLEYKESGSNIKTKEEAINAYLNSNRS
jgi:hypothetical protein